MSVYDIVNLIKNTIEYNIKDSLKVQGELTNLRIMGNHSYFALKDKNSTINCVIWNRHIDNKNGDNVIVDGYLNIYIKTNNIQIQCINIEKIGIGEIHKEYEKLKKKFETKGYFMKKEKDFPKKINTVGILTSVEGAALQDVLCIFKKNDFNFNIIIKNCNVQGINCPKSIKNGIDFFNEYNKNIKKIDILLITRGGGSMEDLMGFSSEEVVKSTHKTKIFTISAIGHEIDNMLCDYSCNLRTSTPTFAGEKIIEQYKYKKTKIIELKKNTINIKNMIIQKLNSISDLLDYHLKNLNNIKPDVIIYNNISSIKKIKNDTYNIIKNRINKYMFDIENLQNKLKLFDHTNMTKKGYSIILNKDNNIVNTINELNKLIHDKQQIKFILSDGEYLLN